ncbi:TatD family hydrolase [Carnobacteriaceae bacterium zg-ZUI240]|nr:TatD family hydrolase [Carnobacteriaceae bacterium zg-ZUI240]
MRIIDSHYHLDFIKSDTLKKALLQQLSANNIDIVAQTITPDGFEQLHQRFDYPDNTIKRVSLGIHPWYIDNAQTQLKQFAQYVKETSYIGEIGLDFTPKRLESVSKEMQEFVFREVLKCVVEQDAHYVLSIHAVKSEMNVIDILEEEIDDFEKVVPIIHRFNGTHEALHRFLKLGGYISIHPSLLNTKKGRAYIRYIPNHRLLFETDLPSEHAISPVDEVMTALHHLSMRLIDIKGEQILSDIEKTQLKLYV